MADAEQLLRNNVQALMTAKNWNRSKLADAMHRTRTWASDFLNGNASVPIGVLNELAAAFEVEVSELFAPVPRVTKKGPSNTKDVSQSVTPSGVGSALPNEGVSVHAVSVQADPLQSRATLQRTYDDIHATIGTLIDQIDTLVAARLRLASLLGRTDDSEQSHGTQSPQTGVDGVAERRSGTDAHGGQKATPLRRTGVR